MRDKEKRSVSDSQKEFYNKILGGKGEKLAAKYLKKKGYKILEKNYKCSLGEADIIARDGEDLVFVEVKTRVDESFGRPSEAVDKHKQEHYRRIAECYCDDIYNTYIRFDVIEICGEEINHIIAAF